jgi:hypothetical protein
MADNYDPDKQIRLALNDRIERDTVLFFDCMTPLIKKELNHVIRCQTEVLNLLLPPPPAYDLAQPGDLDTMNDHLMKHWSKAHGISCFELLSYWAFPCSNLFSPDNYAKTVLESLLQFS